LASPVLSNDPESCEDLAAVSKFMEGRRDVFENESDNENDNKQETRNT